MVEYWSGARSRLPEGAMRMFGPDATGVGWVMQYILADTTGRLNLAELRSLQDWVVKPALTAVAGVAEIASLGGYEKQYQVTVHPVKLQAYGIPPERGVQAVQASNRDVGGRVLELGGTEYVVRGRGRFQGLGDIASVALATDAGGAPVTVSDVADVQVGPELRRGITDLDGDDFHEIWLCSQAEDWLRRQRAAAPDSPFACVLSLPGPHPGYVVPERYAALYSMALPLSVSTEMAPAIATVESLHRTAPDLVVADAPDRLVERLADQHGVPLVRGGASLPQAARLLTLLDVEGAAVRIEKLDDWEPNYGRPAEAQARWEAAHGRGLPDPAGGAR
jgi:hypothetical protein